MQSESCNTEVYKVCFVGAGYVGGTTSAILALKNPSIQFTVVDINSERIDAWNSTQIPIQEPGLIEVLSVVSEKYIRARPVERRVLALEGPTETVNHHQLGASADGEVRTSNLEFSKDVHGKISEADMIFITVNTPSKAIEKDGQIEWDMTYVNSVVDTIAQVSVTKKIIVQKSTVPCGTAKRIAGTLKRKANPGAEFSVLSNPEFLAQGSAVQDLLHPCSVILGHVFDNSESYSDVLPLLRFYDSWVPKGRILTMTSCSAELSKIAHNALFAQRISSINSLSAICDHFDADISDVTKACGLNPRIGPHGLQAGIGFGGSCLRKDTLGLAGLAHELSLNEISDYWSQVIVINEVQTRRFVQELHQLLLFSKTKKIAMLGFAYKKDTGDPRGSIAKDIIISLFERGVSVKLHDPLVSMQDITNELGQYQGRSKHDSGFLGSLELFSTPYDACEGTSIIAVMNDASEYQCLDWGRVGASLSGEKVVLDGRNFLDDELLRPYGITIKRLGRK